MNVDKKEALDFWGNNYLEHKDLTEEIKHIYNTMISTENFNKVIRTDICEKDDYIKIPLPQEYNKKYYVARHFTTSTDAYFLIDGIEYAVYHYTEIDKLSFLSSVLGDKVNYYERGSLYPQLWEHLIRNHRIYWTANALRDLLKKYGKSISVFYANPISECRKEVNDYRKNHQKIIDEIYRECLKLGEVNIKWASEYQLYQTVLSIHEDAIFQYSCEWLKRQTLDVFIPSLNIAIEYQGRQHYESIEFFGGSEAFEYTVKRDRKKRDLCKANGIKLYYWKYDIPVNMENLTILLSKEPFLME